MKPIQMRLKMERTRKAGCREDQDQQSPEKRPTWDDVLTSSGRTADESD